MPPRPLAPQLLVLLLALVLAAIFGAASFAALLAAYAVAWVAMNVVVARGVSLSRVDRPRTIVLVVAIAAAPLVTVAGRLGAIAEAESLTGLDVHLADRLRLERAVAIHPGLVAGDRPQLFFVQAEGARRVRVTLAPGVEGIDAEPLGHGVFRVDYDPRVSGAPSRGGAVHARLEVDGTIAERELEAVLPLAHPRWLRVSPDRRLACTTSEETDELVVIDRERLVAKIATDDGPSDCAFLTGDRIASNGVASNGDASDLVAVSHRYAASLALHRLSAEGATIERVALEDGAAHRLAGSDDGSRLAASSRGSPTGSSGTART